jgi:hypothetical protein
MTKGPALKMRLGLIIAGLIAMSVESASAYDPGAGDRMVYGAGMVTCAEWQKYRSTGNKAAVFQLQAWIDGFFSGYNTASQDTDFIAPQPETVAYYAWIDNYCSQNPLNKVMQAAMALKDELTSRAAH